METYLTNLKPFLILMLIRTLNKRKETRLANGKKPSSFILLFQIHTVFRVAKLGLCIPGTRSYVEEGRDARLISKTGD